MGTPLHCANRATGGGIRNSWTKILGKVLCVREDEAPAEPLFAPHAKRLGRSLALPRQGLLKNHPIVFPAKAGIHFLCCLRTGPRFRGGDILGCWPLVRFFNKPGSVVRETPHVSRTRGFQPLDLCRQKIIIPAVPESAHSCTVPLTDPLELLFFHRVCVTPRPARPACRGHRTVRVLNDRIRT